MTDATQVSPLRPQAKGSTKVGRFSVSLCRVQRQAQQTCGLGRRCSRPRATGRDPSEPPGPSQAVPALASRIPERQKRTRTSGQERMVPPPQPVIRGRGRLGLLLTDRGTRFLGSCEAEYSLVFRQLLGTAAVWSRKASGSAGPSPPGSEVQPPAATRLLSCPATLTSSRGHLPGRGGHPGGLPGSRPDRMLWKHPLGNRRHHRARRGPAQRGHTAQASQSHSLNAPRTDSASSPRAKVSCTPAFTSRKPQHTLHKTFPNWSLTGQMPLAGGTAPKRRQAGQGEAAAGRQHCRAGMDEGRPGPKMKQAGRVALPKVPEPVGRRAGWGPPPGPQLDTQCPDNGPDAPNCSAPGQLSLDGNPCPPTPGNTLPFPPSPRPRLSAPVVPLPARDGL